MASEADEIDRTSNSGDDGLAPGELTIEMLPRVIFIEQHSYPNPWSKELLSAEFVKAISFRPCLFRDGIVVAQSFSHLVVDELHILNLAVAPDERGKGLGTKLLRYILEEGTRRGARHATLEVRVSNLVAQRLYRNFGFRKVGVRKHYYNDNLEDALVLTRALP